MLQKTALFAVVCVAGCGPIQPQEVTPEHEEAARAFGAATASAATLMAPLIPQSEQVLTDHGGTDPNRQMDNQGLDSNEASAVRSGYEASAEGNAATCTTFTWGMGLSGTVTFSNCDFGGNGVLVDGAVTLTITIIPTALNLSFAMLDVGGTSLDGDLGIVFGGTVNVPVIFITADLSIDAGGSSVAFRRLTAEKAGAALILDGGMGVTSPTVTADVTARVARFEDGDCLPSAGSADLFVSGVPNMTAMFLPTTPSDGKVDVVIAGFEIAGYPLFDPCP